MLRPSKQKRRPSKSGNTSSNQNEEETNNSLVDVDRDTEKLTGREKIFYEDQKTCRKSRLSEEIDIECEEE